MNTLAVSTHCKMQLSNVQQ